MIITYCLNNKIVEGYEDTQDCIGRYEPQYSACSKTCGGGSQDLKFEVDIDPVSGYFRGNKKEPIPCPLHLTRECNTHNCPIDCEYVGGGEGWGDWIKNLDSNEKQIGTETRTREISTEGKYGGITCGKVTETRNHDVDCVQSGWWSRGACSNTCGDGTKLWRRSIIQESKNDGNPCGEFEQTRGCNNKCPVDCVGKWEWTGGCVSSYRAKKYKITRDSAHGGKKCPAYNGQISGLHGNACYRTCARSGRCGPPWNRRDCCKQAGGWVPR